jgi:O-antigen/teichoic acid export membrane protein
MTPRPLTSRRTLTLNTVSSVTTRLLQLTVLVWVNQYLLRHISAEEYALLPLVLSLLVFGELFRIIFAGGLGRFLVEADARGDDAGVTRIVSSMLPVLLAAASVLALLAGLGTWQLDRLLALAPAQLDAGRVMLGLTLGLLCIELAVTPFTQGLYVRQRFVALNVIELSTEVLRALLIFALMIGAYPSVVWLSVGSVVAGLAGMAARITFTRRLVPAIRWHSADFDAATARRLLRFGAWTSVQGLTQFISTTAPALVLNRGASAIDVACFHLGRIPDLQLRRLVSAAAIPLQPALTSLQAVHGEGVLHELYYRGGRYHLWLILLVAAPLLVFADAVILLYAGEHYRSAIPVVMFLVASYPVVWGSAMFYRIAFAVGRVGAYYICDLVVQLAMLAMLLFAVFGLELGAPGAALALAGTSVVLHIVLIWPLGLRLVQGTWDRFIRQTLGPGLLPFGAAAVTCLFFRYLIPLDSWARIGVGSAMGAAVYVGVLLLFCLDATDRALVERATAPFRGLQPPPPVPRRVEEATRSDGLSLPDSLSFRP